MADAGYHEPYDRLPPNTRDLHRALRSLQEELEAVDWYRQRADATEDESLRAVLIHNMEEEVEHACMVLEWLRRHEAIWDRQLRTYLFTEVPITEVEEAAETGGVSAEAKGAAKAAEAGRLTVGALKGG